MFLSHAYRVIEDQGVKRAPRPVRPYDSGHKMCPNHRMGSILDMAVIAFQFGLTCSIERVGIAIILLG